MSDHVGTWQERHSWQVFAYTGVFCFAIAILITLLSGGHFWWNAIVSFSIGWSINLSFLVLADWVSRFLGPYATPILVTAIGLCCGLTIAGALVFSEPLFFFTSDYGSLLLGIFFGVIGFVIFYTRGRFAETQAALARAEAERERQEKLRVATELKLLQAQIEPHFLFNTLSNIAGLIHEAPNDAEQTLLNLTTLLRASLKRTRESSTTVTEELEIARAFLDIHSIRMHGRLNYEITCDDACGAKPLPPLLVQPLIENAIKHGIDPSEAGGKITIHAEMIDEMLKIVVADTGLGVQPNQPTAGTGTGLTNVRERLKTLFGNEATLVLTENQPTGMICTLTLPT